MKKYIRKHLTYYIIFASMQICGFFILLALTGFREMQILFILTSTFAYVAWAILHQYLEHSLTPKIMLEYILFGIFGILVSLIYFK